VIGHVTNPSHPMSAVGRLRLRDGFDGPILADVPRPRWPMTPALPPPSRSTDDREARAADPVGVGPIDVEATARTPRRPELVYRQYDHQLF